MSDIDQDNAEKYLMTYIRDLSEFCELAVICALDEARLDEKPWFPTIGELRNAAKDYHETVLASQKYLISMGVQ